MRRHSMTALFVAALLLVACAGGSDKKPSTASPTAVAPGATGGEVTLPLRPDQNTLYAVNADGSGLRKLAEAGYFAASPDGAQLATASGQDGNTLLYLINPASGEQREVARVPGWAFAELLWSPDGAWLAFTVQPVSAGGQTTGQHTVHVYSVASGEVAEVLSGTDTYIQAWSPDSSSLFVFQGLGPRVLKRVDLATRQAVDVASGIDSVAISPDGQQLALLSYLRGETAPNATYLIELARADGSERRELLRLENAFVVVGLSWSPDGKRLSYAHATSGQKSVASGIFTVDVASGVTTRVTQAPEGVDMQADWSPDGTRLLVLRRVCTQCDGPGSKIVLAAADGSGEVALAGTEQFLDGGSSWSPDGTRFVYGADKLYVADADGSNVRPIVDLPGSSYSPAVWAAGDRILFVRGAALPTSAYAAQPDGSDFEVLGVGALAVAPDGETLAGYDAEGFFIRTGDGEPVRLPSSLLEQVGLSGPAGPSFFVWSPDSERVAIGQHQKGGTGLLVASRNGEARLLTSAAWEGDVRWSPGGTRLAYWGDGAIWLVGAGGGEPRRLASAANRPGFDWSPDGARLAFVVGTDVRVVPTDGSAGAAQFLFAVSLEQYAGSMLRWSPDGGHIAVSTGRDLAIGEVETGQVTKLPPQLELFGFEWSLDGAALVFGARPTPPPGSPANELGVYVIEAAGGTPQLLAESSGRVYEVIGRLADGRIVFVSRWTL